MQVPKPKSLRREKYAKWIRRQPCIHCGERGVDAHHHGRHGTGIKTDDYRQLPLCHPIHALINSPGWSSKKVQDVYGLNFDEEVIKHLIKYIEENSI